MNTVTDPVAKRVRRAAIATDVAVSKFNGLTNIVVPTDEANLSVEDTVVIRIAALKTSVRDVLWNAATRHPEYTFRLGSRQRIFISHKGEELGSIDDSYSHRSRAYGVNIRNHRIDATRLRGSGMVSTSVQAAVTAVSKAFYPRTLEERLTDATVTARGALYDVVNGPQRMADRISREIRIRAEAWAMGNGFNAFLAAEDLAAADTRKQLGDKEKYAAASKVASAIVNDKFNSHIVVADDSGYLVNYKGVVTRYALDELPVPLQGIGGLKMTQAGQVVEGVGIHITADYYMVVEQTEEETV